MRPSPWLKSTKLSIIHRCGRFQSIALKIEKDGILTIDDQTLCVGVILVMLLFKNWQRPGAVVNMTSKGGYSRGAWSFSYFCAEAQNRHPKTSKCYVPGQVLWTYLNQICPFCNPQKSVQLLSCGPRRKASHEPKLLHNETWTQIQTRCTNGHSSSENWVHCNSESLQCYRSDITGYTYGQYSTNTAKIASGHNRKAAFSHCKPAAWKTAEAVSQKSNIRNEDEEVKWRRRKCRHQQQDIHSSKRAIELSDEEKVKPWCKRRLFTEET